MTALHGAVAFAEVHHVAVLVGKNLDFDVARVFEELLDVDTAVAESHSGLALRGLEILFELSLFVDHPHAFAAAARRRFDDDRIADLFGGFDGVGNILDQPFASGHDRHARGDHGRFGGVLVAHLVDHLSRWADELDIRGVAHLREIGVLGKEAVAGMDRVGVGDFGGGDDPRNIEVALSRKRRPDADRLVGIPHVKGVGVGGRIDGHRADAHFAAGVHDPQGDLPTVGYEYFLEQGAVRLTVMA